MIKLKFLLKEQAYQQGMRGPKTGPIAKIQKSLVILGYLKDIPEEDYGIYGKKTTTAIRDFQKKVFPNDQAKWTGKADKETINKLSAELAKSRKGSSQTTTKNYPYDILKTTPTAETIAKVLKQSYGGPFGNDKEAWAEAAVNAIKDSSTYNKVSKILGKDVKDYLLTFMNPSELDTVQHTGPAMIKKLNNLSSITREVQKYKDDPVFLYLKGKQQKLEVYKTGKLFKTYTASTGKNGFGNQSNSGKTPIGLWTINKKAGAGLPDYTYMENLKGVKDKNGKYITLPSCDSVTTEIKRYLIKLKNIVIPGELSSDEEVIMNCEAHVLTRALVIDGSRGVYIHGTNYENHLGTPLSGGCIRISNNDVKELFNIAPIGTKIYIDPNS